MYKIRTLSSILLLLFLTVSCQVNAVKNAAPKAKAHANSKSKSPIVSGTADASISPKQYAASLGKGIDVTWVETRKGFETYNIKMLRDFKQAGLRHVRIRVKHEPDAKLLAHLDKVIQDCLAEGLIAIIAYHGGEFEEKPTLANLNRSVAWWRKVADFAKSYSHKVSFDLIVEVTDALNKEKDLLNQFYEAAVTEIRKTNPTRIIFISPVLRSAPEYLKDLVIPSAHNHYLMAEWHFYASGPDKTNENKKWTIGAEAEKDLIRAKIKAALDWQMKTGIYTWVGAWMAGNYNKGNTYTVAEQIVFANFVTCELTKNQIPFAFNADHKYYDAQKLTWIDSVKPVFDEILQTNC